MRFCVVGDVHFSQYSSIVRQRGEQFSVRLENLINSVNFAEKTAKDNGCELIVYLGDFFDNANIDAETITAITKIEWHKDIRHILLCGNHEIAKADNSYNSANVLKLLPFFDVITEPTQENYKGYNLLFLPYLLNIDDFDFSSVFTTKDFVKNIMFSHNDVKDINYGGYVSKSGINLNEAKKYYKICFNGHLHNENRIDEFYNVGNLTGQNFSEDATKYGHKVIIADSEHDIIVSYENPYAFNFYKVTDTKEITKNNAVVTLKTADKNEVDKLHTMNNVIAYKTILEQNIKKKEIVEDVKINEVDHIAKFKEYVTQNIGENDIILQELSEVTR